MHLESLVSDMSSQKDTWPESGYRVERITWLADAIFAFSMTLLATGIRIPEDATDVATALVGLEPRIISFLITFWIVASYWIAFHRLFSYIVQYDRGLIRDSLLFLMFIVLLPFPADMIGRYQTSQPLSFVTPAVFFGATGLTLELVWVHASRGHRLVDRELSPRLIRHLTLQYLISPVVFVFSVPVFIVVSTENVIPAFVWLLIVPLQSILNHKYKQ